MTENLDLVIERLTPGQAECLMLVHRHLTSKEIGPMLRISPHTVDQRIRSALRTLGCKSRFHAAQLVASRLPPAALFKWESALPEPLVEKQLRQPLILSRKAVPLPFATPNYPRNDMSIPQRLLWIIGIGFGSAFSMGVYLAGLESLARLLQA